MKYTFDKPLEMVTLEYPKGSIITDESAEIEYTFSSKELRLTISDWYFGISSIDTLIAFLEVAKEKLNGISK